MLMVTMYHNMRTWFSPYRDGQVLAATTSHRFTPPVGWDADAVAEWAFDACNADLHDLETRRTTPEGEAAFLAGCVYRLLGFRSLSTGDVVHIEYDPASSDGTGSTWLACDPFGWRPISAPSNRTGEPLTAAKVYQHLTSQRTGTAATPSRV
ncbi:hypothetical protein AB0M46_05550 [Dactylosporangium sp. NPDC051485]|uniref:hypothetical protein n=1 Tax=Dactylosporangium sp. NPDC051485 TaxID=3154846 RepID=UPI0034435234